MRDLSSELTKRLEPRNGVPHKGYSPKGKLDVRHVVLFDTETYPVRIPNAKNGRKRELQTLYTGWVFYLRLRNNKVEYRRELNFTTIDRFWGFIEDIDTSRYPGEIYVMAFNVGFDAEIIGIRKVPYDRGWEISKPEVNQGVYIWGMSYHNQKYRFLDIGNFIGGSTNLAEIGKAVELEKLDVSFKDGKTVKDYPLSQVITYCHRDVEIIEKYFLSWLDFLDEHGCGSFKYTLASQAMAAFRHLYPDIAETIVSHGDPGLSGFEHQAYHGGWNELYFKGHVDYVYALDVNSFHPFIMKTYELPYRTSDVPTGAFIIDADIYCPDRLIPIKDKKAGLIFQVGTFRAQFTSVEYGRLLEIGGRIIKEYRRQYYDTKILLDQYVDLFHSAKQFYSNPRIEVYRNMAKYLMNTIEGKFAQQTTKLMVVGNTNEIGSYYELSPDGARRYVKCFAGKKFTDGEIEEGYYNFVTISAFVRARTRVHLSRWMQLVRDNGGKVYYHDTDSLFVDEVGYHTLQAAGLVGDDLGQLQLEKEGSIEFRNLKDYTINNKDYRKGIKASARKKGKGFTQDKFMRGAGMNKLGISSGVVITKDVPIVPKGKYNKGVVQSDGWIRPFKVSLTSEQKTLL